MSNAPQTIMNDSVGGTDEFSDEEMDLVVQIGGGDKSILQNSFSFQLVGLEEKRPLLQLGKVTYAGRYNDLSNTILLLQEEEGGGQKEGEEVSKWRRLGFYNKVLAMERVFIQPKGEATEQVCGESDGNEEDDASGEDFGEAHTDNMTVDVDDT